MKPCTPKPERARWISLLSKAPSDVLNEAVDRFGSLPEYVWLRRPEAGLAMIRARAGGTGAQFNLGEMSVTRCALRLQSGEMGVAYVAGTDKRHAELAAIFDALMQSPRRAMVQAAVLDPITKALAGRAAEVRAQAARTRVEFVTMTRGED